MKYYIGRLTVMDVKSSREHATAICIAANDEPQARALLNETASKWGWEPGTKHAAGSGYYFPESGAPLNVLPHDVQEISPLTFDEMSELLQTVGPVHKAPTDGTNLPDIVKTVSRRLADQLAKCDISVPATQLLQALTAALGGTKWAALKAAVSGKPVETLGTLPRGNPYTGPLRSARSVEFSARVDAIWLAEGDVALAAKLLRVEAEDLLSSFLHFADVDTAFCGRHPDWLPEHSLSRDFGAKAEVGRTFEVVVERLFPGCAQVTGKVNGREVMSINNHVAGDWRLAMCVVPNGDFSTVRRILACQEEVLRRSFETCHADVEASAEAAS